MARLFCMTGELRGAAFEIGDAATIGQHPDNDVVLAAPTVSRAHARIYRDPARGCHLLEDLGSSNGTRLDGIPVLEPEPLGSLHVITFAGEHDFIYRAGSDSEGV